MVFGRRFAAAAVALALITSLKPSSAAAASDACANQAQVTVLPSPLSPWNGAPLRIMAIAEKPLAGTLSLIAPDGSVAVKSSDRHEGPPYSWFAEIANPAAGTWRAVLEGGAKSADCSPVSRDITVAARKPEPLHIAPGSIWQVRNSWNSTSEALFSAWV